MNTEHRQINVGTRLADLYRQMGDAGLPAWLDGDTLAAYAADELSPELARRIEQALQHSPELSALHASLVELGPHSAALAQSLAGQTQHQGHRQVRHAGARHAVRRTVHHRHTRWMSAAAAVFLAIAGVWGWQHFDAGQQPSAMASQQPAATPGADTIFDSGMDSRLAVSPKKSEGDKIFRASFNRKSS